MWSIDIDYDDARMIELILKGRFITDIEKDITKLKRLKHIDLSVNRIKKIPNFIGELINLELFDISLNGITKIPTSMNNLVHLRYLNMSYNRISKFPSEICYLSNLNELLLHKNKIKQIPSEIQNCTSLTILNLEVNLISIIPPEIGNLKKMKTLFLSNNKIQVIPPEIGELTELLSLQLMGNRIKIIPPEIANLKKLRNLLLYSNIIEVIPPEIGDLRHLQKLTLSHNFIREIPPEITKLKNLIEIYISYNLIISLPNYIINCKKLKIVNYQSNPIIYISPQVGRFLDRIVSVGMFKNQKLKIYTDGQNIHNHTIQESIKKSIMNIMNLNIKVDEESIMTEIINDTIITDKTKELLAEYSKNRDYHSVLLITFKELLMYVWSLIQENEHKDEIKAILNTEMLDAKDKCFTGRLSRLVNCLNGFSKLIEIKVHDTEQIANIIILIANDLERDKKYSVEEHKKLVKIELISREYDEAMINEWINEIE
jgi:Leucine-rich repeat (LRR) protein